MKTTTEAIVLGLHKHSDKLSMLHVYSRTEGRLTLQVYGANSKHKIRAAFLPLSVVEITYDANPARTIPVLSALDSVYLPEQVYNDVRKQSIAMFVTEVLTLTLTHPMEDVRIYQFIDDFVHELNGNPSPENMHILFLIRLGELLGIGSPDFPEEELSLLTRSQRQQMLRTLCDYYLTHLDSFRQPKSLDILIEVFD